jgi:hypothetical protein
MSVIINIDNGADGKPRASSACVAGDDATGCGAAPAKASCKKCCDDKNKTANKTANKAADNKKKAEADAEAAAGGGSDSDNDEDNRGLDPDPVKAVPPPTAALRPVNLGGMPPPTPFAGGPNGFPAGGPNGFPAACAADTPLQKALSDMADKLNGLVDDVERAKAGDGTFKPGSYKPGTFEPGTYKPGSYKPGSYKPGSFRPGTDTMPDTLLPGTTILDGPTMPEDPSLHPLKTGALPPGGSGLPALPLSYLGANPNRNTPDLADVLDKLAKLLANPPQPSCAPPPCAGPEDNGTPTPAPGIVSAPPTNPLAPTLADVLDKLDELLNKDPMTPAPTIASAPPTPPVSSPSKMDDLLDLLKELLKKKDDDDGLTPAPTITSAPPSPPIESEPTCPPEPDPSCPSPILDLLKDLVAAQDNEPEPTEPDAPPPRLVAPAPLPVPSAPMKTPLDVAPLPAGPPPTAMVVAPRNPFSANEAPANPHAGGRAASPRPRKKKITFTAKFMDAEVLEQNGINVDHVTQRLIDASENPETVVARLAGSSARRVNPVGLVAGGTPHPNSSRPRWNMHVR